MTTRIEDLEEQLLNPNLDSDSDRAAYIKSEIAKEKKAARDAEDGERVHETVRVKDRLTELETATRAAAPEKAVTRTKK